MPPPENPSAASKPCCAETSPADGAAAEGAVAEAVIEEEPPEAAERKAEGNEHFKAQRYEEAIVSYTAALEVRFLKNQRS
jgi:Flp pilus assembly protein TadD